MHKTITLPPSPAAFTPLPSPQQNVPRLLLRLSPLRFFPNKTSRAAYTACAGRGVKN